MSAFPAGTRVLARDEEWLVRSSQLISKPGQPEVHAIVAIGVTEFVQADVPHFSVLIWPPTCPVGLRVWFMALGR